MTVTTQQMKTSIFTQLATHFSTMPKSKESNSKTYCY